MLVVTPTYIRGQEDCECRMGTVRARWRSAGYEEEKAMERVRGWYSPLGRICDASVHIPKRASRVELSRGARRAQAI